MNTDLITLSGSIGAVSQSANRLNSLAQGLADGSIFSRLRPASLGGVPFAVYDVRTGAGRRNAIHEYPFRDGAWVEDMGREARKFELTGFLLNGSRIYGGGPIAFQRAALLAAVENALSLTLVHPTLGEIRNVNVLSFEMYDSVELGGVSEFRASLIQSIERVYPVATGIGAGLDGEISGLNLAAVADFAAKVNGAIQQGAAIAQQALANVIGFQLLAQTAVRDVKRFWGAVSTLAGQFGRFFGGGNAGFARRNVAPVAQTVAQLIAQDVTSGTKVAGYGAALAATSPANAAAFGAAAQALTESVRLTCADPADAVRVQSGMASFAPNTTGGQAVVGRALDAMNTASAALFRRAALASIAAATKDYQPASLDDAVRVRDDVVSLFDAEISIAADRGDDRSFLALRSLRRALVDDLDSRSEGLPALRTWTFAGPLPALALAQRMYRAPSREAEIVRQANPVSPNFMPQSFRALAS